MVLLPYHFVTFLNPGKDGMYVASELSFCNVNSHPHLDNSAQSGCCALLARPFRLSQSSVSFELRRLTLAHRPRLAVLPIGPEVGARSYEQALSRLPRNAFGHREKSESALARHTPEWALHHAPSSSGRTPAGEIRGQQPQDIRSDRSNRWERKTSAFGHLAAFELWPHRSPPLTAGFR